MRRTDPPLFAGLPYRRLSPAQRAALAARLAGVRARPRPLRVLDCCSGIGGFALAYQSVGWRTAAFCEIDPFCRRVLAHHWPETPCYDDIRELSADRLRADGIGRVDVLVGGPPCQPSSVAGQRGGAADPRWLWPEFLRLVQALRPRWVVAENPPGILSLDAGRAFRGILAALAEGGYLAGWATYGACDVGAPQERERVFIVAHPVSDAPERHGGPGVLGATPGGMSPAPRQQRLRRALGRGGASALADAACGARQRPSSGEGGHLALSGEGRAVPGDGDGRGVATVAHTPSERRDGRAPERGGYLGDGPDGRWAEGLDIVAERPSWRVGRAQSDLGGATDGLPAWMARWPAWDGQEQAEWEAPRTVTERVVERGDKLRALGNAVVPLQAYPIFAAIAAYEREEASA